MLFDKLNNRLRWGVIGGFLGGLIAIIGFWILSPTTDSIILFVLLRVALGSVTAMIVGPLLVTGSTRKKSK